MTVIPEKMPLVLGGAISVPYSGTKQRIIPSPKPCKMRVVTSMGTLTAPATRAAPTVEVTPATASVFFLPIRSAAQPSR